ncbi:guanylate cyclase 32E-like [Cydia fagiglandana]|uniref:guanylate cyclase 32E-like n=1 Tax=Cydia fagiglandana TaxID=1458189 RepID=UPI002FEDEBD5
MRDLGVVAFFGPDDTCHTEAKLAAAWNLPLISHKCADDSPKRDDKATDREARVSLGVTFARTLPPAFKISKSVMALLKAFSWNKFAIVAGEGVAAQQKDAIKKLATHNDMIVTAEHNFPYYIPLNISNMEKIVDQTYDKTRVYVFLGEHIALVDFVKVLQGRGLLQTGDYAVVAVDDEIYDPSTSAIAHADHLGQNSSSDVMAFRAVLKLTPSFPTNPIYEELCQMIRNHSAAPPFCVPNYHKLYEDASVPIEAAHLYDAVVLWARAATAAMRAGLPATDGASLMKLLRPTTYRSVQGFDVYMDSAGDAEGNFTVIGLVEDETGPGGWRAAPVATFRYANSSDMLPELVGANKIVWLNGKPPAAEPPCGFDRLKCSLPHDPGVLAAIIAVAAAAILALALLLRHYRYEQKLASVLWRIEAKDLTFILARNDGDKTLVPQNNEARRAHTTIAMYRSNIVAVKRLQKKSIDVTRAIKKELKQIRELRHENINAFVGVCVEAGSTCIVSAYCSRGSLARVLADRDLHLDDMFVASLVADLLRGLTYLHDSALVSHGNLTSSNCLVDSRWVLQIADYGLHNLKYGCADAEDALRMERRMLWRAPELLRDPNPPSRGSQKGDVYSFGIILYEILGRNGPWGDTNLTNAEIIGRVRQPIGGVLFRPPMSGLAARPSVLAVLNACWSERPDRRPDLRLVRLRLKDMHAGMKTNIFDNMLAMMEKYASNLEALVAARTEQLLQEKRRTDDLLHRMLPRTVAEALKRGERVQAESYDCVTIYFSDIVGFTNLAATNTPMQVVEILNDLYTCCDAIISYYNVYKVETIGDAYMVVGGVPERCSRHAAEVASLALHVLDAVPKIRMRNMPAARLHIRIGIHSGQCAAGVVGVKMPRYCLFGDTVNTAARMESSGEPQRIHVSNDTYKLLRQHGGYHFKERGIVNIKGKGDMKTWWLVGEDHERRKNSLSRYRAEASLQWPQTYHFRATLKIPSANVIEPYEVWSNGVEGHHRFDFYKGMSKMYQKRHGKVNNVVQFQYYWVTPDPMNVNQNDIVCRQLTVNSTEVKRLYHYLPPTYNYKETGPDVNQTTKWEYQYTQQQYGAVFKYALWTTGQANEWVPVRYEYRMFYKGVERDFIQHVYEYFSRSKPDAVVYKIPHNLRCNSPSVRNSESDFEHRLDLESPILQQNVTDLFERFKLAHNRQYKNIEEHFMRLSVFLKNVRYIQSVNSQQGSYKLSVNQFADLTEDELALLSGTKLKGETVNSTHSFLDNDDIEDSKDFDWRSYDAVTPVKDQTFLCGSCYAFTVAAAIESAAYISNGCNNLVEASEQAIIDCSTGKNGNGNQGCNGGFLSSSLQWVKKNGIPLRKDYGPYLAMEGYCHLKQTRLMYIHNYIRLQNEIKAIKAALRQHGPLATVMHVPGSLYYYRSGVYDDNTCLSVPGSQTHAVLIVGYGKENGKRYWLVKNSWGARWGDEGYFKLDMEKNLCGITNLVYAVVDPNSLRKQCKKVSFGEVLK